MLPLAFAYISLNMSEFGAMVFLPTLLFTITELAMISAVIFITSSANAFDSSVILSIVPWQFYWMDVKFLIVPILYGNLLVLFFLLWFIKEVIL